MYTCIGHHKYMLSHSIGKFRALNNCAYLVIWGNQRYFSWTNLKFTNMSGLLCSHAYIRGYQMQIYWRLLNCTETTFIAILAICLPPLYEHYIGPFNTQYLSLHCYTWYSGVTHYTEDCCLFGSEVTKIYFGHQQHSSG